MKLSITAAALTVLAVYLTYREQKALRKLEKKLFFNDKD